VDERLVRVDDQAEETDMGKTALLIIDLQVGILDGAFRGDEVLAAVAGTQKRAREAGSPVVFLQHNHATYAPLMKGAGTWAIHPAVEPRDGDVIIEKTASDGFWGTDLESVLRGLDVTCLAVAGMQTEFCVDATCRAAISRGFDVILLSDGHTTGDAVIDAATTIRHHNYALSHLAHPTHGIRLLTADEVAFGAGDPG
jgi:nicotinamidase-related amidase